MKYPEELKYTEEHEWISIHGKKAVVGITDHAQHALGDIVFVELPEPDDEFSRGEPFGSVESVKAASELYLPVGGRILEVNEKLSDDPALLNKDPYKNWIVKIEMIDPSEVDELLTVDAYQEIIENE